MGQLHNCALRASMLEYKLCTRWCELQPLKPYAPVFRAYPVDSDIKWKMSATWSWFFSCSKKKEDLFRLVKNVHPEHKSERLDQATPRAEILFCVHTHKPVQDQCNKCYKIVHGKMFSPLLDGGGILLGWHLNLEFFQNVTSITTSKL